VENSDVYLTARDTAASNQRYHFTELAIVADDIIASINPVRAGHIGLFGNFRPSVCLVGYMVSATGC